MIAVVALAVLIGVAWHIQRQTRPEPPENVTKIGSPRPLRNPRERP